MVIFRLPWRYITEGGSVMSTDISKAIELRKNGYEDEAIELLKIILSDEPNNVQANYQCAWCHDVLGKEVEAVEYYENAIENGLSGQELQEAYLGLGSTYRVIGKYAKSNSVLLKGMQKFPHNLDLQVFYAMTLYNLGQHAKAMGILLKIISDTSSNESIKAYSKAISFYADKLDQVW